MAQHSLFIPLILQVNCLSEVNYNAAQQQARELDAYWRQYRKPIGPLHGLPVSLMDRYHVEGLDSACGFVSWAFKPAAKNDEGGMVTLLRHLGAVIFCKTAVPMSMMVSSLPAYGPAHIANG